MTQYWLHNDESLHYMNNAIYRINVLKEVFEQFQHDENFNYFKFHVITHYMNFIQRYEDADDFDTFYMKIAISDETHLYAMLTTNLLSSYSRV